MPKNQISLYLVPVAIILFIVMYFVDSKWYIYKKFLEPIGRISYRSHGVYTDISNYTDTYQECTIQKTELLKLYDKWINTNQNSQDKVNNSGLSLKQIEWIRKLGFTEESFRNNLIQDLKKYTELKQGELNEIAKRCSAFSIEGLSRESKLFYLAWIWILSFIFLIQIVRSKF